VALLRQRSRLVHRAVPLLIATIRGLLLTAAYSSRAAAALNPAWPEAVVTAAVVTAAVVTAAVVTEAVVTEAVVTAAVVTEAVVTGTSTADGAAGATSEVTDTARGARHGAAGATSEGVAAGAFPLECVRNLRRLYELLAAHKKVLVRHGSYLLDGL
jgi:hypothetical protein